MKRLLKRHKTFITYFIIGTIATVVDIILLYILSDLLSINVIVSNAISVFCSILLSFYLNARFNFKKTDKLFLKFLSFFGVFLVSGIIIGSLVFAYLYETAGLYKFFAKIISVMVAGTIQFLFNNYVTFK